MKLSRYRVTNFRSVKDSGWIEVGDVTALIGVNESGKTNLLIPLWKLNPAREGEIQPTSDYPKKMFGEIREAPGNYTFVAAEFATTGGEADYLATVSGVSVEAARVVAVSRSYDGESHIAFPLFVQTTTIDGAQITEVATRAELEIQQLTVLKAEDSLKSQVVPTLNRIALSHSGGTAVSAAELNVLSSNLRKLIPLTPSKSSALVPRLSQVIEQLDDWQAEISAAPPTSKEGVLDAVLEMLPKFVYYSNYGNLDSEIYLPHVVDNLARKDLGAKEAAKARTLRVLFKFVRLQPPEILQLGRDFRDPGRQPTAEEITGISEKKRERAILLQSAGTTLTDRFREWWKQGDYRFRFDADGDHFRIWVADDRRSEEVELESRSTGLQWFLSFYLVFLVESEGEHRDAILLLDEPGLSLHPLAQRDLSTFFDGLAAGNQILYTTHSPFLVDADRLDRVRKVFVSDDGTTKASPDLRRSAQKDAQAGAGYAVYSALNLNVSESLLLGCQPVIVEGASDQHYLTMMKTLLIGGGKIAPKRELVFPPSGGTRTLRISASILTGRDESLPVVFLDCDEPGRKMAVELRTSLYRGSEEKVLTTDQFAAVAKSELEDLIPTNLFAEALDRLERDSDVPFADYVKIGAPLVPQVEAWAKEQGMSLQLGWKVEVAKRVKQTALSRGLDAIDPALQASWIAIFTEFSRLRD